ncbi:NPP1-domain-containing protein [Lophiostoma macrostomum CBS 122681]|uniref:NPP1-domain-containing protein n=1 Tax=Lophiostoma macrostomum CBS 122681 TaxID=1314788 RepID=A0A6A6SVR4_9PLEO|nr:NPP1-domain-containing protein [Lophiostoma macrostomum CBS 122681]
MKLSTLLALVGLASTTPTHLHLLSRRDDCSAVDLVGLAASVPDTIEGTLMLQWQPYLYVVDGCVPFPAVDSTGCTSAGLSPSGDPSGDCDSSTGQVYARAEEYNGAYAIMYSWYFPKDEPSWLESVVGVGHRYDWEDCVVWLSEASTDATLLGVSVSYHGDYQTSTDPALSGDHPLIKYYSAYSILDHSMGFTSTVGGMQPLVAWESLSTTVQSALADKDWGDANVPFIDSNFEANLAEAVLS